MDDGDRAACDAVTVALASCPQCRALFRTAVARCPRDQVALVDVDVDPLVGTTLDERYHLEAIIGDGGSGRVYRARRWRSAARFAVKVPFGDLASDPRALQRLEREAEAMSRIDHPNLVGIVDRGVTERGLRYLAMPLVEGALLTDVIARGPLAPTRAVALLAQMADGLAHAHERGLIHRDLKPDNILVEAGPHGEVARVVDFGIVLLREGGWERLTAKGMVVGTPEYMSPEQLVDTNIGPASDLYSLGLVFYEMLVGDRPFSGTVAQVASKHLSDPLPTLTEGAFGPFDPRLDVLVRWMTRKKARDRVPGAASVAIAARAIARSLTSYESGGAVVLGDQAFVRDRVGEFDAARRSRRGQPLLQPRAHRPAARQPAPPRPRRRRPSTVRQVRLEPAGPTPATTERRTMNSATERRTAGRRTSTRMRALPGRPPSIVIPRLAPATVEPPARVSMAPAAPRGTTAPPPAAHLIDPDTADTLTLSRLYRQVGERITLARATHGRPAELLARRYAALAYLAAAARSSLRPGAIRELLAISAALDALARG